jgi:hypothetical protein
VVNLDVHAETLLLEEDGVDAPSHPKEQLVCEPGLVGGFLEVRLQQQENYLDEDDAVVARQKERARLPTVDDVFARDVDE